MNLENGNENIKRRILLVEGNHLNIRIMSRMLQGMGVDVVEAINGEEAIKYAVEELFSMIFMCGFMPEITGYKITKKIRELSLINKNIPIIAVSSNRNNFLTDKMVECGISDIVSKPLRKDEIDVLFNKHMVKKANIKGQVDFYFNIFDVKEFEAFYDDEELRKEVVQMFIDERDNDLERMNKAFKSNNIKKLYDALHYMKGSFTYLKAQNILTNTQNILDLLKVKKLGEALLLENLFFQKYDTLFEELNLYNKSI